MRHTVTLTLAAVTIVGLMALGGASSAFAGSTALCSVHEEPCSPPHQLSSIHLALPSNEIWLLHGLSPEINILCLSALAQATVGALGAPQQLSITALTFGECGTEGSGGSHTNCTVTTSASSTSPIHADVLRIALNLGELEFLDGLVKKRCTVFGFIKIECEYRLAGLVLHFDGATAGQSNGLVLPEGAVLTTEGGSLCPDTHESTAGKLEPLTATYIVA